MKTISLQELKQYKAHTAIFFTSEGILVEEQTRAPFVVFDRVQDYFDIKHIFLDDDTMLIVQGQLKSCLDPLSFSINSAKTFLTEVDGPVQNRLLRAIHWVTWHQRIQYCGHCGGDLVKVLDRSEKYCASCRISCFPNLSVAVMMLVQREDEILLARSPHFKPGMYSALAGFIGLGETAEAAVHREVFEEVGLIIRDLTYFGSQSWPFPASFMIAFKAQYESGTLCLDPHEIEDARWFSIHSLPPLPPPPSISHALIQSALTG